MITSPRHSINRTQNRAEYARALVESNGGKLHGYYHASGNYDAVVIYEVPDNMSTAALALAVAAGGAVKAQKTTVLMSAEEGLEAMRQASGTGYRPPGS